MENKRIILGLALIGGGLYAWNQTTTKINIKAGDDVSGRFLSGLAILGGAYFLFKNK